MQLTYTIDYPSILDYLPNSEQHVTALHNMDGAVYQTTKDLKEAVTEFQAVSMVHGYAVARPDSKLADFREALKNHRQDSKEILVQQFNFVFDLVTSAAQSSYALGAFAIVTYLIDRGVLSGNPNEEGLNPDIRELYEELGDFVESLNVYVSSLPKPTPDTDKTIPDSSDTFVPACESESGCPCELDDTLTDQ